MHEFTVTARRASVFGNWLFIQRLNCTGLLHVTFPSVRIYLESVLHQVHKSARSGNSVARQQLYIKTPKNTNTDWNNLPFPYETLQTYGPTCVNSMYEYVPHAYYMYMHQLWSSSCGTVVELHVQLVVGLHPL